MDDVPWFWPAASRDEANNLHAEQFSSPTAHLGAHGRVAGIYIGAVAGTQLFTKSIRDDLVMAGSLMKNVRFQTARSPEKRAQRHESA